MISTTFLIKTEHILQSFNEAYDQGYDFFIFEDGDHITLRHWSSQIIEKLLEGHGEISMSFECGHVSLQPFPTYNSGLMIMKVTKEVQNFLYIMA